MGNKPDIEHFNPDKHYPPFDPAKTIVVDGKELRYLVNETDISYLYPPPDVLVDLSLITPFDHRIRDALSYNSALQLLDRMRPRWPLRLMEWLVIPDTLIDAKKRQKETEKYLSDSLTASTERRTALIRVARCLSHNQISQLSSYAQKTIREIHAEF